MNQFAILAQIVGQVERLSENADDLMVLETDGGGQSIEGWTDLRGSIDKLIGLVSDLCGVMTDVGGPAVPICQKDHSKECCTVHDTHSSPHIGCLLR